MRTRIIHIVSSSVIAVAAICSARAAEQSQDVRLRHVLGALEDGYGCRAVFEDVAVRGKFLSDGVLIPRAWLELGSLAEFRTRLTNRYPQLTVSLTQNVIYIACLLTNASYNRLDQPVPAFRFNGPLEEFEGRFLSYHCQMTVSKSVGLYGPAYNPMISIASNERLTPIQYLIAVSCSNAVSWKITRSMRGEIYDFNNIDCLASRPGQKQ